MQMEVVQYGDTKEGGEEALHEQGGCVQLRHCAVGIAH